MKRVSNSSRSEALVCGLVAFVGAITLIPSVAAAQDQPWLQDRRFTQGIGIRVGDFELHPGAAVDFGYDSNFLHRDDGMNLDEKPIQSLRLRVTPSFSMDTLGAQRREVTPGASPPTVEFHGAVSATYNEYIPIAGGVNATDRSNLSQQRNVGGDLDLKLAILPQRPWSVNLTGNYLRDLTPSNGALPAEAYTRDIPRAGAEVVWQPGGGLFDWRLGYNFQGTFFENSQYQGLSNLDNQIETRGRWRFLPRSALLADARFDFINYPNAAGGTGGLPEKTDSHPLRVQMGYSGLVTPWFSVLAMAGWGASFYTPKPQDDFDSVIGQAELRFYLTPNPNVTPGQATLSISSLAFGFQRDFFDNYIGTYGEQDRGYAKLLYFFGGQFLLQVEGGAGPVVYSPAANLGAQAAAGFTDVRVDAQIYGEYRIKDVFGIGITGRYTMETSPVTLQVAGAGADSLAWKDIETYLTLRYVM
ncbi:MAG TPA: hypothetical protein VHB21_26780 [Minicystis sp.]|nr:hypothetical protein [Minicystis sp.]